MYPNTKGLSNSQIFPNVDHHILLEALGQTIACLPTLALCQTILTSGVGVLADEYPIQKRT